MKISKKVAGVEYAIRDIVIAARQVEKQGTKITYLNIGDPIQYGFQPPQNVKDAMIRSIQQGHNYYAQSEGLPELRDAISLKEKAKGLSVSADDILVTNGVSEALDMVMSSIVEEGDEVLLPGPYYPPYASYVRLHGGKPVEFAVDLKNSTPDIADIKSKITSKTVAICLISPKFTGIGKVSGDSPIILLNGFSKVHLMSGWRIGYVAFNNSPKLAPIRENLPKLARVRISTNLPVQYAALESLQGPQGYVNEFVSELKKRRDFVVKRLNSIPGLSCSNPKGAFYAFPKIEKNPYKTDQEFVMELLRKTGVLTVHGSGFGTQYGSGHFRIVFLPDIKTLDFALNQIEKFCQ
ncbi:MAG: aminotransferase class I/II-fold pyridoxal phosphate-dependent enzyme [Nitrososphaeria archaeon]|nr:aminotransferase class I/II-fold pyridoxal phosphate-dependent enzyme [Nitrososphaeria archaeon]